MKLYYLSNVKLFLINPMHPNSPKRLAFATIFTLFILVVFTWSPANAQRRHTPGVGADGDMLGGSNHNSGGVERSDGWGISLNAGYETPRGDVGDFYKAAPTFGATVTRRMGNVVYSGTIDYRSYKPKQAEFTESEEGFEDVVTKYSNYQGTGFYLGIAYEVPLTGLVDVYAGVNGGFVITKFDLSASDGSGSYVSVSGNTSVSYFGPKLGFNCAVGSNMSIGAEGRYGLGITGASYNSREGGSTVQGFSAISGNLFLTFHF
ncbi:hypothetical protein DYU05_16240 [Mucilaginibacter terrenus]|uniref:Outer membrane protein beta-barrel domain-containing protein n=1 Tax=Mucilaginibacter terrenus TaxID=2482727 RepID=A0A3E2NMG3_9SPHI|nr:hypothetical protein [Mucilaginibacter terrenus]RFZ82168.1 hypothetical protein DYU05_16240 [Mucilaginibacter terrenus]